MSPFFNTPQSIFDEFPRQINQLIIEREILRDERDNRRNGQWRNDDTLEMARLQRSITYRIQLLSKNCIQIKPYLGGFL